MKSLFLFWLLFVTTNNSLIAQQYWTKPYLLVENTLSAKQYKIKPEAQILLKTITDSVVRKVWFTGFASDSSIYIYDKKEILLSEIDYLCIRPILLKRTTKQVLYVTGTLIFASACIGLSNINNSYRVYWLPWVLFTPPITILGTPLASSIAYELTPRRSFQRGKNLTIKIINP